MQLSEFLSETDSIANIVCQAVIILVRGGVMLFGVFNFPSEICCAQAACFLLYTFRVFVKSNLLFKRLLIDAGEHGCYLVMI